ncbi:MAG: DUF2336 domain-containing protein [Alphaproteobacteria bacterium]|nr:DUF2336 domain-containing protein [Alphaproteobacteria bacterium]
MRMALFEKAGNILPLLERLESCKDAYAAPNGRTVENRVFLTETLVDLLEIKIAEQERETLTDILTQLVHEAERDLRHAIADRLSTMADAPLQLVLALAHDEISVADKILRESEALGDIDLLYIIRSKSHTHWRSIAARRKMGDRVVTELAKTKDFPTALQLSLNDAIVIPAEALDHIEQIPDEERELGNALLRRKDIPQEFSRRIYQKVGERLETAISQMYVLNDSDKQAVHETVLEFHPRDRLELLMPSEAMIKTAEIFHQQGRLTVDLMLTTLNRGQSASFIAQFAQFSGLKLRVVYDLLTSNKLSQFASICRALNIGKVEYAKLVLLTKEARNDLTDYTRNDFIVMKDRYELIDRLEADKFLKSLKA